MAIDKVGVIGAGQMGTGIAHVLALAGMDVVLEDINADALSKARGVIEKNMHRQAARGIIKDDVIAPAMARIRASTSIDDMKDRELVIEAATEDEATKRKIFADLCPRLSKTAMLASNTSSISITRL
ncbi:MAG TPA: 3-hydroxyacyl-CoA dehydrogenase NAD-binding domain-containing protein, partial [Rhizomicrobium sp.]|nr:3-hydroxyacyl-CoA dehydrogenase NAD-binding domain-containing protein [Rhizomicrobium sp.]